MKPQLRGKIASRACINNEEYIKRGYKICKFDVYLSPDFCPFELGENRQAVQMHIRIRGIEPTVFLYPHSLLLCLVMDNSTVTMVE